MVVYGPRDAESREIDTGHGRLVEFAQVRLVEDPPPRLLATGLGSHDDGVGLPARIRLVQAKPVVELAPLSVPRRLTKLLSKTVQGLVAGGVAQFARVQETDGKVASCELTAPQAVSFGKPLSVDVVTAAISVDAKDAVTKIHGPQVTSVGLPFVMVELQDRSVLERARINMSGFEALGAQDVMPDVYLYTHANDGFDIRARMFAPLSGVPEDPATGSANCALAGLLAHYNPQANGSFTWRIAQGVEMGRPSTLIARAEKMDGVVETTRIGGASILVSEGFIYVD